MSNSEKIFYAGIDAGASKTELLIIDESGSHVLNRFYGPGNLLVDESRTTFDRILNQIRSFIDQYQKCQMKICIGLSGIDTDDDQQRAERLLGQDLTGLVENWRIVNDGWIALRAGSNNPNAIVLISGTGSNCLGKNQSGLLAKAGGMDYLLSDEGSGYGIGTEVLHAVTMSADGRIEKSALEELVYNHFSVKNINQLKTEIYHPPLTKKQISELALACFRAAENGDGFSLQIIDRAVLSLVQLIKAVANHLQLIEENADLVLVGSVAEHYYFNPILVSAIKNSFPKFNIMTLESNSVIGACLLSKEI